MFTVWVNSCRDVMRSAKSATVTRVSSFFVDALVTDKRIF